MSKVTGKLQVTIPKAIAERFSIRPGDEIEFRAVGGVLQVMTPGRPRPILTHEETMTLFDEGTERVRRWAEETALPPSSDRGWKDREELYTRGEPR